MCGIMLLVKSQALSAILGTQPLQFWSVGAESVALKSTQVPEKPLNHEK